MFASKTYKSLLVACLLAMAGGLAVEAALGLGCFAAKWSADSLAVGLGVAVLVGVLMMAAVYFAGAMVAAKYIESSGGLVGAGGVRGVAE